MSVGIEKLSKILIFGNSGSGKSTLAKKICTESVIPHLDLDTVAWLPTNPPERKSIPESYSEIQQFINRKDSWVIEGCYSDLLALLVSEADEIIYLNLSVEKCIENSINRPWEPDKYPSQEAQDANLSMLQNWIQDYTVRNDACSKIAQKGMSI